MTADELFKAKDPDLIGSFAAMKRAAEAAKKIAIQTDTCLVIFRNNQVVQIPAAVLRSGIQ